MGIDPHDARKLVASCLAQFNFWKNAGAFPITTSLSANQMSVMNGDPELVELSRVGIKHFQENVNNLIVNLRGRR